MSRLLLALAALLVALALPSTASALLAAQQYRRDTHVLKESARIAVRQEEQARSSEERYSAYSALGDAFRHFAGELQHQPWPTEAKTPVVSLTIAGYNVAGDLYEVAGDWVETTPHPVARVEAERHSDKDIQSFGRLAKAVERDLGLRSAVG